MELLGGKEGTLTFVTFGTNPFLTTSIHRITHKLFFLAFDILLVSGLGGRGGTNLF